MSDVSVNGEPEAIEWVGQELPELDFHAETLSAITAGDPELLKLLLNQELFAYLRIHMRTLESTRQIFMYILSLSLYAAHLGGLLLETGCPLCLRYQRRLMLTENVEQVQELICEMMLDFAGQVRLSQRYAGLSPLLRKAAEHIDQRITEKLSLAEIAAYCSISPSTLQRRFRVETGLTVSQYLRQERINKACLLLDNTAMSGSEIGYQLGYCSQSYFICQFKLEKGMTPAAYRSQSKKLHD